MDLRAVAVELRLETMKQRFVQVMQWNAVHPADGSARRDVCRHQDALRLDVVALAGNTPRTYGLATIDAQPRLPAWGASLSIPDEMVAPEPPDGNGARGLPTAIGPGPAFIRMPRHHGFAEKRRAA